MSLEGKAKAIYSEILVDPTLSADIKSQQLEAIAKFSILAAATSFINLSVDAKYSLLEASGITGLFLHSERFKEIFAAVDRATIDFTKSTVDYTQLTQLLSSEFGKKLKDIIKSIEVVGVTSNKPRHDNTKAIDSAKVTSGKVLKDTPKVADTSKTKTFNKKLKDTISLHETISRSFINKYKDSLSLHEILLVERVLANVPIIGDPLRFTDSSKSSFGKSVKDSGKLSESKKFTFNKSNRDTVSFTSNQLTTTLAKPKRDNIGMSESGYITITNYCEDGYLAEAYVGVAYSM